MSTKIVLSDSLSPQVIRQVMKELQDMVTEPPEGIKVLINERDVLDIQALIEGPIGTPYAAGIFRVKLILKNDFPITPPKANFLTKIFHPNVSANGEICVNTLKKDWRPDLGLKHILITIKCLLIAPNPESALNAEAGQMLLEEYENYFQRARLMTEIHAKSGVEGDGKPGESQDNKMKDKIKEKLHKEKKRVLKRL
ncbi:ubiquitin-conjugating enzyme E2 S-like [Drosophila serrata]|uniref:ubiquitin-conjugating enzyme E2 S-like n=1 Tax=Drosophila serrata TaxID=7274 RepID=UPI000A1D0231|nr:ubiquitin-conjugating enzyme E2 S-like [Drosophila serrata]